MTHTLRMFFLLRRRTVSLTLERFYQFLRALQSLFLLELRRRTFIADFFRNFFAHTLTFEKKNLLQFSCALQSH